MKTKIEFTPGETVVCTGSMGAELNLTLNKTYLVVEFFPEVYEANLGGFTWPAYLRVVDDTGRANTFHAHRFAKINSL